MNPMHGSRVGRVWVLDKKSSWLCEKMLYMCIYNTFYRCAFYNILKAPKILKHFIHLVYTNTLKGMRENTEWSIIHVHRLNQSVAFRWASLVAQMIKNLPAMQETQVWFMGQEAPLQKGMATHSSILAWWAIVHGLQRVRQDWTTNTHTYLKTHG